MLESRMLGSRMLESRGSLSRCRSAGRHAAGEMPLVASLLPEILHGALQRESFRRTDLSDTPGIAVVADPPVPENHAPRVVVALLRGSIVGFLIHSRRGVSEIALLVDERRRLLRRRLILIGRCPCPVGAVPLFRLLRAGAEQQDPTDSRQETKIAFHHRLPSHHLVSLRSGCFRRKPQSRPAACATSRRLAHACHLRPAGSGLSLSRLSPT